MPTIACVMLGLSRGREAEVSDSPRTSDKPGSLFRCPTRRPALGRGSGCGVRYAPAGGRAGEALSDLSTIGRTRVRRAPVARKLSAEGGQTQLIIDIQGIYQARAPSPLGGARPIWSEDNDRFSVKVSHLWAHTSRSFHSRGMWHT